MCFLLLQQEGHHDVQLVRTDASGEGLVQTYLSEKDLIVVVGGGGGGVGGGEGEKGEKKEERGVGEEERSEG